MSAIWFLAESGGAATWALTESAPSAVPNPPGSVVGAATGATTATGTWSDLSGDETGFDVQVEIPAGSGNWQAAAGAANPAAAGVQSFAATGFAAATQLRFRVRSFNGVGPSAWVVGNTFATDNTGSGGGEIPTEPAPAVSASRTYVIYPDPALPDPVDSGTEVMPTWLKDPAARLDYTWNWGLWLADADDAVGTFTVELDAGLASDRQHQAGGALTYWVTGPAAGQVASMRCHIVTRDGRVDDRTIRLQGIDR